MRAGVLNAARPALLAGPTVLAFFSGGYFDEPRAWAGLAAWGLVALAGLLVPDWLPRGTSSRLAIGGLAALAAWTLLSITWSPVAGNAYHAGQIVVLYTGTLIAAVALLRSHGAQRAVEPALAFGVLVVIGYSLSERLLPGLLHFARSVTAQGRLEQPLTYWNAMGELAALGFVLCARIAGDRTRPTPLRAAAPAAAAPLGMGLYLSISRGAVFACAAGMITLIVVAPRSEQLRALLLSLGAAALAALAAAPFRGVTALAGNLANRERQGAITLALLAAIMVATTVAAIRTTHATRVGALRLPRRAPALAAGLICAGLALAIVVGQKERSGASLTATRLVSLQSSRYDYWRVALRAFAQEPLHGVGAGGWSVYWLRYRHNGEFAQDAHSLPLQTLAELGAVGLALLAAFLAGIAMAARDALRAAPAFAAGPIAAFATYIAHSPLDWDWQMPAVTLVAIVLAGGLLAGAESEAPLTAPRRSAAPRGGTR